MTQRKRIVITGGTGFVGSNMCRRLASLGHEIHLLVRPSHNDWRIQDILSELQIYSVDFLDIKVLKSILSMIQPDWIFHLAAYGAYSFQNDTTNILNTNFISTHHLVEAALDVGFESFVNTGSSSEYGFKTKAHTENDVLEPNSYYAVSKAATTLYCSYTAKHKKVQMPTLRLYSVYGRYEDPRRLMPRLILKALESQYPPLVTPDTARDFIFIEDVIGN